MSFSTKRARVKSGFIFPILTLAIMYFVGTLQ
jgi:hypothetical protein